MKSIIVLFMCFPGYALAKVCDGEAIAFDAALALERVNKEKVPMKMEMISLSSEQGAWAVVFYDNSTQRTWRVQLSGDSCKVLQLVRE